MEIKSNLKLRWKKLTSAFNATEEISEKWFKRVTRKKKEKRFFCIRVFYFLK